MAAANLLKPVRFAGRTVYEAVESQSLASSGNSVGLWFEKSFLELVGLLNGERRVAGDVDVDVRYQVDPEEGTLTVEAELPIQDEAVIYEWLGDPAMVGAKPDLVADGGESD